MNFFLLYVSLPALLFGIMARTPFSELNNPPFLIATTLGTMLAFALAAVVGKLVGKLSLRESTIAGLAGAYGNVGYMGPGLALAIFGDKAAAPTALIFCCDSIFLFTIVPLMIELTNRDHASLPHALGVTAKQIILNPADHVGLPRCAGGGTAYPVSGRAQQYAAIPAERRSSNRAVRAGRHGGASLVRSRAVGGAERHRRQAPDPSV